MNKEKKEKGKGEDGSERGAMDEEIRTWLSEAERVKGGVLDLSRDEDASIAAMNLISLEEHCYFSAMKTGKRSYTDMLDTIRKIRIRLLKTMVTNPEGEEWCMSKHLLAGSMRLMEVGTKELGKGRKDDAWERFKDAFDLYSLFFAINLRPGMKEESNEAVQEKTEPSQSGMMMRVRELVKKAVDCCKEW